MGRINRTDRKVRGRKWEVKGKNTVLSAERLSLGLERTNYNSKIWLKCGSIGT